MNNWRNLLIKESTNLFETMKLIDKLASRFLVVVDNDNRLIGTVTDGDIRRGLIKGLDVQTPVHACMNKLPRKITGRRSRLELIRYMQEQDIQFAPVVNEENTVIGVVTLSELVMPKERMNTVVLMAGGPGTRLGTLTETTPKPMLKLGDKPIMQLIIENLRDQGFKKFLVSVNYLAAVIEDYFGDGSKLGVQIDYLKEETRLGTAGSLSLIKKTATAPYLVLNADLFVQMNFGEAVDYFEDCQYDALMCVRQHDIQVPYGVVRTDGKTIEGIDEKPVQSFYVNAGIYVLTPDVIKLVPKNKFYEMTHLFEDLKAAKKTAGVFPIYGYWRDLGTQTDLKAIQSMIKTDT